MYGLKEYKNVLVFVIYLEPWEEGIINIIICCKIHHYTCSTSPLNIPSSLTFFLSGKIHYQLSKYLGFLIKFICFVFVKKEILIPHSG